MLGMLLGLPEIWKQWQGVWEMIDVHPMKAWYSIFNRNTESVTMKLSHAFRWCTVNHLSGILQLYPNLRTLR